MLCPILVDSKFYIYKIWRQQVFICTKLDILIKASDIIVELSSFVWEARLSYVYRYTPIGFGT